MLKLKQLDSIEIIYIVAIILIISIVVFDVVVSNINEKSIVVTVTDKGVKVKNNDSKYLIYTKDKDDNVQVLKITDSILRRRFNSSDVYAVIEPGKTYKFTTVGYRIPIFSMYPNILKYQEVE